MTRNEQSIVHLQTLKACVESLKPQVQSIQCRMSLECDQIEIKTAEFKERFRNQLSQYHQARAKLEELEVSAQHRDENVKALNEQFEQLSNELDEVKKKIHDKGKSMTDNSVVSETQRALARLKEENREMDIHIGILYHEVTQARHNTQKDEESDEDITR